MSSKQASKQALTTHSHICHDLDLLITSTRLYDLLNVFWKESFLHTAPVFISSIIFFPIGIFFLVSFVVNNCTTCKSRFTFTCMRSYFCPSHDVPAEPTVLPLPFKVLSLRSSLRQSTVLIHT